MNRNTFEVMDWIIANPRPDLEFAINSNLGIPKNLIDRYIEKAKRITGEGSVARLKIFTSAEAHGKKAEYIRHGLNYNQWLDNIDRCLEEVPELGITIMSTFNALSVTSYSDFLADHLALRIKHISKARPGAAPLLMDFPYLRHPEHQAAFILTPDYNDIMAENVEWIRQHVIQPHNPSVAYNGFHQWEIDKFERVAGVMSSEITNGENRDIERADFYRFFSEHDRRRGTNFLKTFPEMKDFWELCRRLAG
jgi:hypothetical protein